MAKSKGATEAKTGKAAHHERFEVLKTMLEDRRREIQDKLRSLRDTLPVEASTVKDADRVVVIDGGLIVEEGTHDQLMARAGLYRRLVERQFVAA